MIERKDLISDEALMAPALLTAEYEKMLAKINSAKEKVSKGVADASASKSIKDITDSVQHLTDAEKEVVKIQTQLSSALAKSNDEYLEYKKLIADVNKANAEKIKYGNLDAKAVDAQNSSITQLGLALQKNRQEYANLRTETQRNSAEGKTLLSIIQKQDAQFKQLKTSTGQTSDRSEDYVAALRKMRLEMKSAEGQMASIAETLGQDSKEYQEAAKRAGELADRMADAKDEAKAFQGDTAVENLSTRFGLLGQKLASLDFKGAANQMQAILKLSRQMTFKETFAGLGQLTKGFLALGRAILTNPLFIIAAVIIGLGVAIYKLRDSLTPLKIAFDFVGGAIEWVVQKLKDFSDQLGLSTFAADAKAEAFVKAQEKEMDALEKRYSYEIRLAQAAGKETDQLEIDKFKAFKAVNDARIKEIQNTIDWGIKLSETEEKQLADLLQANKDFDKEIEIIQARIKKRDEDAAADRIKREQDAAQKIFDAQAKAWDDLQKAREAAIKKTEKNSIERQAHLAIEAQLQKHFLKDGEKVKLNEAERAEINRRIAEYMADQRDYLGDLRNLTGDLQKIFSDFAPKIQSIYDSLTARRLQNIEIEKKALEEQTQRALELAGDNEAAKAKIEADAERRRKELERRRLADQQRQARFDKAIGITGSLINTSVAITKALPNIPLAIYVGILGALETAAIAAQPIPRYEKGTRGIPHKGGWAMVGERGQELVTTPKSMFLTPGRPTYMNLPAGSEVIPNDQTMKALAMMSVGDQIIVDSENAMMQNHFAMMRAVYKQGAQDIVKAIYENGRGDLVEEYSTLYRIRKLQNGNKQKIRLKAMGL